MADDDLVARVRHVLASEPVTEQKMFGGTSFLLNGNMIAAASTRGLMIRVDKDDYQQMLARPHAEPVTMGARTMAGFVRIADDGIRTWSDLADWIGLALAYVRKLPPKAG